MIKKLYLVVALMILGYSSFAEGYAVNVQGNKQIGMGHVGTALNWDASSLQFNPGALATLKNTFSFSAGGSFTFTNTEFKSLAGKEESDNPVGTPFYAYGAYKLNDKLAVGLGVYSPFGNKVDWGKDWSGRYLIQDITLTGIFFQPTVSYQLTDWLSAGAGLNVVYGSYDLNKAIPFAPLPDGAVNLSGNTIELGYNVGLFIQATEKLNFGVSYRSKVDMEVDNGDAEFSNIPVDMLSPAQAAFFSSKEANAILPLPASLNVGVAYQINDQWLVSADVNAVFWDAYQSLDFTFEPIGVTQVSKREWDNTMIYRVGAQYSPCSKWDLRAGFYYDETPTNEEYYSPETPGANKIGISTGFSYKATDHLSIDASLLYINGEKHTAYDTNASTKQVYGANGFGGEYKNTGWIPGIGITYNF